MTRDEFIAYIEAFNRDDFDTFSSYYAEDVEFNLGDRKQIIGRQGIIDFYRGVKAAHPRERLPSWTLSSPPPASRCTTGPCSPPSRTGPISSFGRPMKGDVRRIESINLYELENDKFTRIKSARYKQYA